MTAVQFSRRGFLGLLGATTALAVLPARRAFAQALPVYQMPASVTSTGRVVVSSVTLNGSTTALSIGDRVILSRAATQVARTATTRAVANRTMGLIATRMLGAAATAGPWGLAAAGLGVVAYGAYRYFTADDEAGTGTGTQYSVMYDTGGSLASIRAALSSNNCSGLPANTGTYPDTIVLGAVNGSSGCFPMARIKKVIHCTATALAGLSAAPTGWSKAHTADKGIVSGAGTTNEIREYWVFYTKNFAGNSTTGWTPEVFPSVLPATVPSALPADVRAKAPAPQTVADLANGIWQDAVPSSDTAALPWSSTVGATASDPGATIRSGATTVADPAPATIGDLIAPRPAVAPNATVEFVFPDDVVFPGESTTNPNPGTGTGTSSGPVTINWGTPPADVTMPTVTPMSWFPSPFTAPDLAGQCSGWTFPLPALGTSLPLDPCPHLATLSPVVRPVCAVTATVIAGKVLLET